MEEFSPFGFKLWEYTQIGNVYQDSDGSYFWVRTAPDVIERELPPSPPDDKSSTQEGESERVYVTSRIPPSPYQCWWCPQCEVWLEGSQVDNWYQHWGSGGGCKHRVEAGVWRKGEPMGAEDTSREAEHAPEE